MRRIFSLLWKSVVAIALLIVFAIAVFAVQARLRETKSRHEAAPSEGHFVQADDLELFVQEMGPADGQAILFFHGTAAWSGLLRSTMTPFANAGYHCIAVDVPPFGFSARPSAASYGNAAQARRIVALMDTLNIEHAILFVHSIGGGVTMETALSIADRVDGLILLDIGGLNLGVTTAASDTGQSAVNLFLDTPALRDPVLSATAMNPLLTRKLISSMVLDPNDITDEEIGILQKPLVLAGATDTLGDWLNYTMGPPEPSRTSDPSNYAALTMPTLIIWGDSDTVIPLSEGERLQKLIPQSQLVIFQGVNHVPYLEDPEKLKTTIMDFLEQAGLSPTPK